MIRYEDLIKGLRDAEDAETYFLQFFTPKNYKEYEVDYVLDSNQCNDKTGFSCTHHCSESPEVILGLIVP